jgi:hypothetical protein
MSVLLKNQADSASVISSVIEDSTYDGFYSATMAGAAGEYTAAVLLDSLPIHSGEGAFVWNGTDFVYPLDAPAVRSALGLSAGNLDTQLGDIPTVAEFDARSLPAADYFAVGDYTAPDNAGIAAILIDTDTTIPTTLAGLSTLGTGDLATLATAANVSAAAAAVIAQGNSAWVTATGFSVLTGADIATALTTYGVSTAGNVTAAQTAILAGGFVASDRTLLTTAKTTAEGVAIGDHLIDYAASTATQKDAAGNVIAVFDLLDENDNPATSASTAVKRVRR